MVLHSVLLFFSSRFYIPRPLTNVIQIGLKRKTILNTTNVQTLARLMEIAWESTVCVFVSVNKSQFSQHYGGLW